MKAMEVEGELKMGQGTEKGFFFSSLSQVDLFHGKLNGG